MYQSKLIKFPKANSVLQATQKAAFSSRASIIKLALTV